MSTSKHSDHLPDQHIVSVWQRLALATNSFLTAPNLLSVGGLLVVLWGAERLYHHDWQLGVALVIIGRLADLADGYVARRTGTATALGELIDTTSDKLGILALLVVGYLTGLLSPVIVATLLTYSVLVALFALIWGIRYRIRTNRFGKLAMFTAWVLIGCSVVGHSYPNAVLLNLTSILLVVYIGLGVASLTYYVYLLRRVVTAVPALADWTKKIGKIVFVYNPDASNFERARQWSQAITEQLDMPATAIDLIDERDDFIQLLKKPLKKQATLVMVAGGDGTQHAVVNLLMDEITAKPSVTRGGYLVLPLWGGNANDFASMLNGGSAKPRSSVVRRVLSRSNAIAVPLIKLEIGKQTLYACCYASFGASAYAARQLDGQRPSRRGWLAWFPPLLIVKELGAVMQAYAKAPRHRAEIDAVERKLFEHSLINGSRMAKVNWVPMELTEPRFLHALVEHKGPSVLITIARIIMGKKDTHYSKRSQLSFTAKNKMEAQVDGELLHVSAGTAVTASITVTPKEVISFISSRIS
jgi:cardiolipin synthase